MELPATLLQASQTLLEDWANQAGEIELPGAISAQIPMVFACSEYVARQCIRHPQRFAELVTSGDLQRKYAADEYQQQLQRHDALLHNEEGLIKFLRQFRQREMVRIIWRDLTGLSDLAEVMYDLSKLADACTPPH